MARSFAATAPGVRSLIDTEHLTTEALGFTNVPAALWVDEDGRIVRGPESASVERSALYDLKIDDGWPDRLKTQLAVAQAIPSDPETYRNAIIDWALRGSDSPAYRRPAGGGSELTIWTRTTGPTNARPGRW
jgi:hypothetical protein